MKLKALRDLIHQRDLSRLSGKIHYHVTEEGDSIPAIVKCISGGKTEKFVLIHGNFLDGNRDAWVKAGTLYKQ